MAKKTELMRVDPEFKKLVQELSYTKSAQEKDKISSSRITQAMKNQYMKYPELTKEINTTRLGRFKKC